MTMNIAMRRNRVFQEFPGAGKKRHFISCLVLSILIMGCGSESERSVASTAAEPQTESGTTVAETSKLPVNVYFGDLHVHTSWSTDAYAGGNRVGPDDAYRFARGETITLPTGMETRLTTPLDFVALTDHAEGFDAVGACLDPDHPQYDSAMCDDMRQGGNRQADYLREAFARGTARPARRHPDLCETPEICLASSRDTWVRVQEAANRFNDPGRFTALIGYEFSALLPQFGMLHRNVIFKGEDVIPHAISSADVANQKDFFNQLDAACDEPCQVLTIPHNTNYSWGRTFARVDEDGSSYAAVDLKRRSDFDRVVEITQLKGNSECQIGVGHADEECDFGNMFPVCGEGEEGRCAAEMSFVRNALLDGIQQANEGTLNPFQLGFIGSTDTHNSDPGNTNISEPSRYGNILGDKEAVAAAFKAEHPVIGPIRYTDVGGLAAVWAAENTRDAIWSALHRRESFATSGSRMRIRFFGGGLPSDMVNGSDQIATAYATGVPMGGELKTAEAPVFWAWAVQDPAGPKLDRIQVVKGWIEGGEEQQKIWDLVCADDRVPDEAGRCPDTQVEVDTASCAIGPGGAAELQSTFMDAEFDPSQEAFYYIRVLEVPACRWSTWVANSAGLPVPDDVPTTVQQRGWSSPIWSGPSVR